MAWWALHLAQVCFTLARDFFHYGLVALHLAQVLFTLARDFFIFGLVALHLAQVLFTLARDLFTFGQGPVYFWLGCPAFSPGLVYFG